MVVTNGWERRDQIRLRALWIQSSIWEDKKMDCGDGYMPV